MAPKLKHDIGGSVEWREIYELYGDVFLKKAATKTNPAKKKELISLDEWYMKTLPEILETRRPMHLTHDELKQLTKWKVSKGKFRPTLQKLVSENDPKNVKETSKRAFQEAEKDVVTGIKTLSTLRGVGPATASAVLAAGCPTLAPFMSDEAVLASGITNLKYDIKCYSEYLNVVQAWTRELRKQDAAFDWTAHKVELVLWTSYMARQLDPECLNKAMKRSADDEDTQQKSKKKK